MKIIKKNFIISGFCILTLIVILYISIAVYIGKVTENDTKVRSDVILVLGAKSYHGNSYNPCLVSRVYHAVDLYKAKYAPKILFSGGFDREDKVNEAETMKKIAVKQGVASKDILLEKSSTSTYENLLFSQKILQSSKFDPVIIVTEPFHSPRAELIAKKIGMNFTISPAVQSSCWTKGKYFSKYFLKEPIAIILYKIQDRL